MAGRIADAAADVHSVCGSIDPHSHAIHHHARHFTVSISTCSVTADCSVHVSSVCPLPFLFTFRPHHPWLSLSAPGSLPPSCAPSSCRPSIDPKSTARPVSDTPGPSPLSLLRVLTLLFVSRDFLLAGTHQHHVLVRRSVCLGSELASAEWNQARFWIRSLRSSLGGWSALRLRSGAWVSTKRTHKRNQTLPSN